MLNSFQERWQVFMNINSMTIVIAYKSQLVKASLFININIQERRSCGPASGSRKGAASMFYDVFCDLCKQRDLTPGGAAREIGFNRSSITLWKNNGTAPRRALLVKIADF